MANYQVLGIMSLRKDLVKLPIIPELTEHELLFQQIIRKSSKKTPSSSNNNHL